MNRSGVEVFPAGTPQHVIADAALRQQKSKNLATSFNGEKNPRRALVAANDEAQRMSVDFGKRVATYLKVSERGERGFKTLEMQTLGKGILAAHDTYAGDEYDVYFDPQHWEAVTPQIWGNALFPPGLQKFSLGVLPGIGRAPAISSIEDAFVFAQEHLRPTPGSDAKYDPSPRLIDLR